MDLQENIKKWVKLDNNYKILYNQLKDIREEKNNISNNLFEYFTRNNVKPPNINISDGKISFIELNNPNTISYKFLEDCFNDFFKDTDNSKELLEFIKSKRIYNKNKLIKRAYNKEV